MEKIARHSFRSVRSADDSSKRTKRSSQRADGYKRARPTPRVNTAGARR